MEADGLTGAGRRLRVPVYGIVGAADYNACQKNCDALRDAVGVKALDDRASR